MSPTPEECKRQQLNEKLQACIASWESRELVRKILDEFADHFQMLATTYAAVAKPLLGSIKIKLEERAVGLYQAEGEVRAFLAMFPPKPECDPVSPATAAQQPLSPEEQAQLDQGIADVKAGRVESLDLSRLAPEDEK